MRRNRSGFLPLLLSLGLALLLCLWDPVWLLLQLGCTLLGAALEVLLVFLTRREYSPWRLLPLAGLLVPEALALHTALHQTGFFWELEVAMILILALHYFLGWLGMWLLFRRKEDPG